MNKVHGGTPDGSVPGMCATCRSAIVVRGQRPSVERTFCRAVAHTGQAVPVSFRVTSCTAYTDARQPTLWDLEQTAWELTTSPSRKLGFISPQDRGPKPPPR